MSYLYSYIYIFCIHNLRLISISIIDLFCKKHFWNILEYKIFKSQAIISFCISHDILIDINDILNIIDIFDITFYAYVFKSAITFRAMRDASSCLSMQ